LAAEKVKAESMQMSLTTSALALALLGSAAFFATPSFGIQPDVDSPAGPELPAPRTDRPDFQLLDPEAEGADPRPPSVDLVEPPPPSEPDLAPPPSEPELAPPLMVPEP
jgi:hypothetical protein